MMRASFAFGLTLCSLFYGCGRSVQDSVTIQPRVKLSTLLVSEALAAENPQNAVRCPINVINHGSKVSITLEGTGCSCYGVYYNGERLTGETPVEIAAGESQLTIQAAMPTSATSKSYQARFAIPGPDGNSKSVETECVLELLNDVEVEPRTWSFHVQPEDVGKPQRETATITHHYRGEMTEEIQPEFPQLPDKIEILKLERAAPPEEIEPGLWRCQWIVDFEVTVPADANPDDVPFPVQIHIKRNGQLHEAFAQLITRVKLPISYPRQMHLGRLFQGETKNRRLLVTSPEGTKYRLQLKQSVDQVDVQFEEELTQRHWIDVAATPSELGEFQRTATFVTGLAEQPEIEISIVGVVVERRKKDVEKQTEE